MKTTSSDVADEEQFIFTQTSNDSETIKQTRQRKEQSRQNAIQWVADMETSKWTASLEEFTKIDRNATSYSMKGVRAIARIRIESDVDLVLKNLKLKN